MTVQSNNDRISSMIQTFRRDDPRLADVLESIADDLHDIITEVSPIAEVFQITVGEGRGAPPDLTTITVTFLDLAIQLVWSPVTGGAFYEIREGATWATATFILKTASQSAVLNPRTAGTYNMIIKAIGSNGEYSADINRPEALLFDIVVPTMGTPDLTSQVIDNNVLLYWTIPSSVFKIDYYIIYKDNVEFAQISGNFLTRFEAASGTFLYEVAAVDVAGSVSPRGGASATVREPPDYDLEDEYEPDYSLGTIVNGKVDADGSLVVCIDVTETITDHFDDEGYLDPEDQVTGGWARWIQENLLTGSYEEKKDYGSILENLIVNVTYVKENFAGTSDVSVLVKMNVSDDDAAWAGWTNGPSQFFESFRYLKFRLEFTGANDDAMIAVHNLKVTLNIKKAMDSGVVTADKDDAGGTTVTFNKSFRDVDSVTAEADAVEPLDALVDFTDVPNPTGFEVLVFDGKGQRVDATVYWKARGLV